MSTVLKLRPFKVTKGLQRIALSLQLGIPPGASADMAGGIGDSVPDLAFSNGVFLSEHAKWQRERRATAAESGHVRTTDSDWHV